MKKYVFLALTVIWLGFIFFNSLQPAMESSRSSSVFVHFVIDLLKSISIEADYDILSLVIRKCAHLFEFFILVLLFYGFIYYFRIMYKYYISFTFISFMAILDETLQVFSEGRGSSVIDVLIDMAGGLIGVFILSSIIFKKKKQNKT